MLHGMHFQIKHFSDESKYLDRLVLKKKKILEVYKCFTVVLQTNIVIAYTF